LTSERDCLTSGRTNDCGGDTDCIARINERIYDLTHSSLWTDIFGDD
jgi:hypothetical protein